MALLSGVNAEEAKMSPAQARALIEQWVTTERLISEEQNDWEVEQARLQELIELYKAEIELLSEEVKKAGETTQDADAEQVKMKGELETFQAERRAFQKRTKQQAARLVALSKRFPQPLRMQLREKLSVLESGGKSRDLLLAMLDVLQQTGTFNRIVTVSEEQQQLEDGEKRQLRVLYMGLGQAYFVSGKKAGIGKPGADGWVWTERDGLAPSVKRAIAVFEKTAQVGLVELPVEVKP